MFTNLSRTTLPEQIAQSLLDFISSNDLKPGDLLPSETALAADFGVSRPVVREALKSLVGQGIIEIINGRGAMVKDINDESLRLFFQRAVQIKHSTITELLEVRRPLEIQSAMLAAQRRTDEEMVQLRTIIMDMRQCLHNMEVYAKLDLAFHLQVACATHNAMMYYLISSIREALKDAIGETLSHRRTDEQCQQLQAEHEAILGAIEQRDATAAGKAITGHFDAGVKLLEEAVSSDQV